MGYNAKELLRRVERPGIAPVFALGARRRHPPSPPCGSPRHADRALNPGNSGGRCRGRRINTFGIRETPSSVDRRGCRGGSVALPVTRVPRVLRYRRWRHAGRVGNVLLAACRRGHVYWGFFDHSACGRNPHDSYVRPTFKSDRLGPAGADTAERPLDIRLSSRNACQVLVKTWLDDSGAQCGHRAERPIRIRPRSAGTPLAARYEQGAEGDDDDSVRSRDDSLFLDYAAGMLDVQRSHYHAVLRCAPPFLRNRLAPSWTNC